MTFFKSQFLSLQMWEFKNSQFKLPNKKQKQQKGVKYFNHKNFN